MIILIIIIVVVAMTINKLISVWVIIKPVILNGNLEVYQFRCDSVASVSNLDWRESPLLSTRTP